MPLRDYVFKTTSENNLLCRWTRERPGSWILIQLLRGKARGRADAAIFTLHGPGPDMEQFLRQEFGQRYGTYETLETRPDLTSVQVTNYLLPAYRGADPVEMAIALLGPSAFFFPLLVEGGYIHVRVIASPPEEGRSFAELLKRMTLATRPEDFQLVHSGTWDPIAHLKPRSDRPTERQLEVLKLAIDFGYYDEPRRCTLDELAKAFGVSKAAVHKRLIAAESKIIKAYRP